MNATRPTASGTLQKTPFEHLLLYLLDRRLTGTVVFETPTGAKSAVLFQIGVPAKAKTAEPVMYLGRLLLEGGIVEEAQVNATLTRLATEKKLHGQLLLETGAIDAEQLRSALREQLARQLEWLLELPGDTAYGYYADADFLAGWGGEPTPVRPLAALLRVIRAGANPARVARALKGLGDEPLRFHPESALSRFDLGAKEQSLVDVMRAKPQSLRELNQTRLLDPGQLGRLVYAFVITRHLDLGEGGGDPIFGADTPSSSRRPRGTDTAPRAARRHAPIGRRADDQPPAPEGKTPGPTVAAAPGSAKYRAECEELHAQIDKLDYYKMLGVELSANSAAIQAAFFQAAKKWHPDKLPREMADLKSKVTKIFARLSEAHQVLADEERREEYARLMKEGDASSEELEAIQRVLRAATAFQKAEVLLKKRDIPAAEEQARSAYEDDPEQAEYVALFAWVQGQMPEREQLQRYDDLIVLLDQAVAKEPENVRILWYRGQLLKRADKMNKALKDFRKIVNLQSSHTDAAREIRLWDMRKRSGAHTSPGAAGGGKKSESDDGLLKQDLGQLWGRLFKKD